MSEQILRWLKKKQKEQGFEEGKQEGIEQGIAKNKINDNNITIDIIAKSADMSIEKIKQILEIDK